jgi:two-component system phosphate regulon response regulator PhoB
VRSLTFQLPFADQLDALLVHRDGQFVVPMPPGEEASSGEWVLAIFEVGASGKATAAAAQVIELKTGAFLVFEERDRARLRSFCRARLLASHPEINLQIAEEEARQATLAAAEEPPISADQASSRRFGVGARVLLVDDDPIVRELVTSLLETVGFTIVSCESAEEALSQIAAVAFDLLVIDWGLPGMSGLDLCRNLRKEARTAAIPVLFLSSNSSSHDMVDAFASGADDYVVKPFRASELGARILGLLRRARLGAGG